MPKIIWSLDRLSPSVVSVTDSVMSFSYNQGRQNYLDQYSGGTLNVTLNNQNNVAQYFTFNSVWHLKDPITPDSEYQSFWMQDISFNDYPGNTGLSTITVSLVDVLARNGRNVVSNVVLPQDLTYQQLGTLWSTSPYQIGGVSGNGGSSTAAAITYSGSMLNYLNLIDATEKGLLSFYKDAVVLLDRSNVKDSISGMTFTRNTASATAISYYSFGHNKAGLNFMNNVTVTPNGLASQTATNSTSVSAYGNAQQSVSTVDYNTTQALGLAQWLSNSQADPEAETWSLSFQDVAQNNTALIEFLETFYGFVGFAMKIWNLVYRVPGSASDTTVLVFIEGIEVNATPEQTVFTVYFSPATYYQFFTLDSTTFGILGGAGITYNQPEIVYDETGWIYNDANVEQGSRLGW